jgi:hypothetical protein
MWSERDVAAHGAGMSRSPRSSRQLHVVDVAPASLRDARHGQKRGRSRAEPASSQTAGWPAVRIAPYDADQTADGSRCGLRVRRTLRRFLCSERRHVSVGWGQRDRHVDAGCKREHERRGGGFLPPTAPPSTGRAERRAPRGFATRPTDSAGCPILRRPRRCRRGSSTDPVSQSVVGSARGDQPPPSQCRDVPSSPTAQTSCALLPETPRSTLVVPLGTTLQAEPFQWSSVPLSPVSQGDLGPGGGVPVGWDA